MKRFTEADKWLDPWFRQLTPTGKVFWLFLLDSCDIAGVWERDDAFFQFVSGSMVEVDAHIEELGDRVVVLDASKILIPKFVLFQQGGELKESKPFHRGILKTLQKHHLEQDGNGMIMALNGKAMAYECHTDGMAMPTSLNKRGISKSKNKGEKVKIPEALQTAAFDAAWNDYLQMRKENNWGTLKAGSLKSKFKTFEEHGEPATVAALIRSVEQGWRGVFPEKEKTTNQGKAKDDDRDYANACG